MLLITLQTIAILLVAIAMAPAIAHAFEFPGKKRLGRDTYVAVQGIYYPGFTLLGIAEPAALLAVVLLLILTPAGTSPFWLTLIATAGLLGMQAVYWLLIHPTNSYWLRSASVGLGNVGGGFFAFDPAGRPRRNEADWTRFRDRWEYSHIARAGLAFLSFLALVMAALGQ
jgi:hypothetical protein